MMSPQSRSAWHVQEATGSNTDSELVRSPVPFHSPCLGEEEEREVLDTLRSGWLTTGAKTQRFEEEFAQYANSQYAVAVNSCTAALHLSLVAAGVRPGDEVITSPITFASTVNVIEHVGAKPVFVDVQSDTLNMDPQKLPAALSERTRAIIPVHFAGHPCDMDLIESFAACHGLAVIEDAAHAIESVFQRRKIGSISPQTCFSFYATKNITTGEGGMITTNDRECAESLRIMRSHGISADAWKRYVPGEYRHWDTVMPGYKYNMFDLQASLGLHQLRKIDQFHEKRKELVGRYDEAFADVPEIIPLKRRAYVCSAYHLYAVRFATECLRVSRDELMNALQASGVGIGVHFRPVHLHAYYRQKYGFQPGTFPIAEYAGDRIVSLPLFPTLQADQQEFVIEQVRRLVEHHRT